jgi:hypothetical protein
MQHEDCHRRPCRLSLPRGAESRAGTGLFLLAISTQWRQAKDPDAEFVKAKILLDRQGLLRLREIVDSALQANGEVEHVHQ